MTTYDYQKRLILMEQHFNRIDAPDELFVTERLSAALNAFVHRTWPSHDGRAIKAFYENLVFTVSLVAVPDLPDDCLLRQCTVARVTGDGDHGPYQQAVGLDQQADGTLVLDVLEDWS